MNLRILLLALAATACRGAPADRLVDNDDILDVQASSTTVLTRRAPEHLLMASKPAAATGDAKPAEAANDAKPAAAVSDAKPAAEVSDAKPAAAVSDAKPAAAVSNAKPAAAASDAKKDVKEPTMEEVVEETQKLVEAAVAVGEEIAQEMKSTLPAGTLEAIKEEISGLAQTVLNEISAENSANSLLLAANGYILKLEDGAHSNNSMEGIAKLLAESDVSEVRQKAVIEQLTAGDKDNVLADFVFDLLKNEAAAEEERVQELARSTILAAEQIVETGKRQAEQLETDVSAAFSQMMPSTAAMSPVSPIAPAQMMPYTAAMQPVSPFAPAQMMPYTAAMQPVSPFAPAQMMPYTAAMQPVSPIAPAQMMPMYAHPQMYILPMAMPVMANPQMPYGYMPPSMMDNSVQMQTVQRLDSRQQVSPPRGMPSPDPMPLPTPFPKMSIGALINGFDKLVSSISSSPDAISGSSMQQMDKPFAKSGVSDALTEALPAVKQAPGGLKVSRPAPKASMVDQKKPAAKEVAQTPTANESAEQ